MEDHGFINSLRLMFIVILSIVSNSSFLCSYFEVVSSWEHATVVYQPFSECNVLALPIGPVHFRFKFCWMVFFSFLFKLE